MQEADILSHQNSCKLQREQFNSIKCHPLAGKKKEQARSIIWIWGIVALCEITSKAWCPKSICVTWLIKFLRFIIASILSNGIKYKATPSSMYCMLNWKNLGKPQWWRIGFILLLICFYRFNMHNQALARDSNAGEKQHRYVSLLLGHAPVVLSDRGLKLISVSYQ